MTILLMGGVILAATCAFYFGPGLTTPEPFERVINAALVFICFHMVHALLTDLFIQNRQFADVYAPYGLLYGAFYYFSYQAARGRNLTRRVILVHIGPFLAGLILYAGRFIPGCPAGVACGARYGLLLYSLIAVSLTGYSLWGLFIKKTGHEEGDRRAHRLTDLLGMVMLMTALALAIYIVARVAGHQTVESDSPGKRGILLYIGIFGAVVLLLVFKTRSVSDKLYSLEPVVRQKDEETGGGAKQQTASYSKSSVPPELLDEYEKALRALMEKKQAYLEEGISLDMLEEKLRIPKHHLSQLFTFRIGKHFNTYVNDLRIGYAKQLLTGKDDIPIGDIAALSGFASRVSFNRQFRQSTGCSPSEFRERAKA